MKINSNTGMAGPVHIVDPEITEGVKGPDPGKTPETTSGDNSPHASPGSEMLEPGRNYALGDHALTGTLQQSQLKSLLDSKTLVKKGMEGPQVSKLQDFLISKGYMTKDQKATGPGKFGPQTDAALKAFQKDHGLKADGIVGPKTRAAMESDANIQVNQPKGGSDPAKAETKGTISDPTPKATPELGTKEVPDSSLKTTRSLEDQAKLYDKYSSLVPEGKFKEGTGEMNIVGLRHHDVGKKEGLRSYDDRFVVLWKDEEGNKRIKVFEGATHTGQTRVKDTKLVDEDGKVKYKAKFTDVSGDGRSDIAYIKPGTYEFHTGKSAKYGDHLRPDAKIAAWRDTNQDGKITGKEADKDYNATAILFHKGGTSVPRSVGCQTMSPSEFDDFMALMKSDPNGKVTYTLVDAAGK